MQQWLKIRRQRIWSLRSRKIQLPPSKDRATLLVCICIALFFWLLVKLSRTYSSEKRVSFQFELPQGKTFVTKPPSDTRVQLQGSGWELMFDYLYDTDISLYYNLSNFNQPTLTSEQLRRDILRKIAFNNIRITDVQGDIPLRLEAGTSKRVPILPIDSLTFATGYHLTKPVILEPDSVSITGPISLIYNITSWNTKAFRLTNLKNKVIQTVDLEIPLPELSLSVNQVQAIIEVEQLTEKSLFVPLIVRNAPPDSLKYFPEKVKVTCTIGLSEYNNIDTSDFRLEIDLAKVSLKQGKHTLPIQIVRQPAHALSVQFTPKSAEFFIFKR